MRQCRETSGGTCSYSENTLHHRCIFYKFAAYLQNIYFEEHSWLIASKKDVFASRCFFKFSEKRLRAFALNAQIVAYILTC